MQVTTWIKFSFKFRCTTSCLVGKSWDFHVKSALRISNAENLEMIDDSISYASRRLDEIMFDAEHFFDGYKANLNIHLM